MNKLTEKELYEQSIKKKNSLMDKYPLLYSDRRKSNRATLICYGLEVGDGWVPLIDELSAKLEVLIKKFLQDNPDIECEICVKNKSEHTAEDHVYAPMYPKAAQCKEKWAGLRFYMTSETPEMSKAISEAEHKSLKTCEDCGAPGERYGGVWLRTLCSSCAEELNKNGRNYKLYSELVK